jgi:hypothetical protein
VPKGRAPKMNRFQFLGFGNRVTIRTFNKETYILNNGLDVRNTRTNRRCKIDDIFYAKRKNKISELYEVS